MGGTNCKEKSPVNNLENDDIIETNVGKASALADNEMKEVVLNGDHKVLLIKQNGSISAIGNRCSHYGAPLVKGALGDCRVRCPWHGACFNIKTGDIEDFPGLDSIPSYQVHVDDNGDIKVRSKRSELNVYKRVKGMSRRDNSNMKTAIIVGGGGAGATCVEALRQEGFTGHIIFVCKENVLPYDRPKLTKAMDQPLEKIVLRTADFYKHYDIEVLLGTEVKSVDTTEKKVTLSKGEALHFDALFIATGSDPRKLKETPGRKLKGIAVLRNVEQANKIASHAKGKKVVIYGNSFIGMEVAAYLSDKAESVTVIGRSKVPFENVLGTEVGGRLAQLFTEAKVNMFGGHTVKAFKEKTGHPGEIGSVELDDGTIIEADICVLGLGTIPATHFIANTSIVRDERNGTIPVDKHLSTNIEGIWAGGDVAATPLQINDEEMNNIAIGHWQVAHYHGKIAAANMVAKLKRNPSKMKELHTVPFFWCMIFGKSVRYAGYGSGYQDIVITGDLSALKFAAYYLKDNKVVAIATVNNDPLAAKFAEHLASKKPALTKDKLENDAWATK